jgi:hypothetical protein
LGLRAIHVNAAKERFPPWRLGWALVPTDETIVFELRCRLITVAVRDDDWLYCPNFQFKRVDALVQCPVGFGAHILNVDVVAIAVTNRVVLRLAWIVDLVSANFDGNHDALHRLLRSDNSTDSDSMALFFANSNATCHKSAAMATDTPGSSSET